MRHVCLILTLVIVDCQEPPTPPTPPSPPKGPGAKPMILDATTSWGSFFLAERKDAVLAQLGGKQHTITEYTVDRVSVYRDKAGVEIQPGTKLIRIEGAMRFSSPELLPLFEGVPQHQHYTTQAQRPELAKARAEVTAGQDTVTVLIPIRKSAKWWALSQDDRQAHFHTRDGKPGHTAIGLPYTDRIFRKLYHTRYAVQSTDHDFLTYFEFGKADTKAFEGLLAALRDEVKNPEWGFVDREYEIWMSKDR